LRLLPEGDATLVESPKGEIAVEQLTALNLPPAALDRLMPLE
jgi:hypothetical protein